MDLKKKAPNWLVIIIALPVMIYALNANKKNSPGPVSDSEHEATKACRELILQRAAFPSSVEFHYVAGVETDLNGVDGKPRVTMDFDAKNELGNMLPYRGGCNFSSDPPVITIHPR